MTGPPEPPVEISEHQRARAATFRRLHHEGTFVMPCAWDAGSARMLASCGFAALGTTSGGVNWSRGRPDYVYSVDRREMLADYAPIAAAVDLAVSADLENGYGPTAPDVAATVAASIGAGFVGGSIEDQSSDPKPGLFPIGEAVERIAAARAGADALLPDYTITARAESFFGGVDRPFADAVDRANRYLEAGANCIFVPGPADLATIAALVAEVVGPVSVGIGSGGGALTLPDLENIGVRRVSTGGALPRAIYALIRDAGREMLDDGRFGFSAHVVAEPAINELMATPPPGRNGDATG